MHAGNAELRSRTLISRRATSSSWRTRPMRRRGYHPPINVRSFNITARKRQALSSPIPVRATSTSCCRKARRFATARSWVRIYRLGPAWPRSAARKNGRDGRRPRVRNGGSARFPIMSKAVRTIRWVRARYTFTPAARTHCIASTARTSQDGSDMRFHRAASGLTNEDVIDLYSRVKMGATGGGAGSEAG